MEDATVESVEKLFYQKIMLYHDLLHCFEREKEALINIDLDKLWKISKEKEELCSKIQSLRLEIISATSKGIDQKSFNINQILDLIPRENRAKFQKLNRTLIKLKSEIEVIRKENMIFMDDSLQLLDEMISIITGENRARLIYTDKCRYSKSGNSIVLSREA